MQDLWRRITPEVAYTVGLFIYRTGQLPCRDLAGGGLPLEVKILAKEAIEGTGLVEDSQVSVAVLGTFGHGITGVAGPCPGRTDKASHAIGGEGVIVERKVSLMGPPSPEFAAFTAAEAAEAAAAFGNSASVHTQGAGDTLFRPWRVSREAVGLPAVVVDLFDIRPDGVEMTANTLGAKADRARDGLPLLSAMPTRSHQDASLAQGYFTRLRQDAPRARPP